jgi:hypothetical protein
VSKLDEHDVMLIGKALQPMLADMRAQILALREECAALKTEVMDLQSARAEDLAKVAALEQKIVNLRYCGVWSATERYFGGNRVTFDGSQWEATCASEGEKPGTSPSWQLSVKRGRDGKNGVGWRNARDAREALDESRR